MEEGEHHRRSCGARTTTVVWASDRAGLAASPSGGQPAVLMLSALQPPVDATRAPAQRIFTLKREVLFRARAVVFTDLTPLGGIPSWREECHQAAMTARAGARAMRSLGASMVETPFLQLPREHRNHWEVRAPVVLSFGARMHGELARLSPARSCTATLSPLSGLFQLLASLFDWVGDEDGGGAEIATWLPPDRFSQLFADRLSRRALVSASQGDARPATAAFIALLAALVDGVHDAGRDSTAFMESLDAAYGAELASFESIPLPSQRSAIARAKSVAPTVVIGELACLDARDEDRDLIRHATAVVAPIFSVIDDLADLTADLGTGHVNTIRSAAAPLADADVSDVVRSLIASGEIEDAAAGVAGAVRALDSLLCTAAVDARRRAAASRWLRTLIWQWLS